MLGIIPAAGKGTRFKELGKQYQKSILPYNEKPLLISQIEYLEKYCDEIIVVVNHQKETIIDYLNVYDKEVKVKVQNNFNGLSCAILTAIENETYKDVLIILGDILVQDDIKKQYFNHSFVSVNTVNDYSRWCMAVTDEDNNVIDFCDKPQFRPNTNKALSGVYYLKNCKKLEQFIRSQIFKDIKISNEFQFSTVLSKFNDLRTISLTIKDFGTLEEYLTNKNISKSRNFNDITFTDEFCIKSSKQCQKITDEYNWYNNLPLELKIHTPRVYDLKFKNGKCSYTMEKIEHSTLRELYLFIDSSYELWKNIFNSCSIILDKELKYTNDNSFLKQMHNKTVDRLNDKVYEKIGICKHKVNNILYALKRISEDSEINKYSSIIHGDFCFSNLFYNFEKNKIIMVDPRGQMYGNILYEYAKLMHSAIYHYDIIDAELYSVKDDEYFLYDKGKENVSRAFWEMLESKFNNKEINAIMIICASLFLSMIPLHSHNENNQKLFYNTFLKIYDDISI